MDKNASNSNVASGGIGLLGAVFLVFLVLKLTGIGAVATWSWWWVTAPLWGAFALGLAGLLIFAIGTFVSMVIIAPIVDWSRRRDRLRRMSE